MKNVVLLISGGNHDEAKIGVLCSKNFREVEDKLEQIKTEFEDSLSKIVEVEYSGNISSKDLEKLLKTVCKTQVDYVIPKEDKKREDDDEQKFSLIGNIDDDFYEKLDEAFDAKDVR